MSIKVQYTKSDLTNRLFPIFFYRRHPFLAARDLLGLDLAPHHALILRNWFRNKEENFLLGSRGTGKSVLIAIAYILHSILWARGKLLVVGGGGFRQSKFVMLEIEKIIKCRLSNQRYVGYARACLENPVKVVNKDAAYWSITFKNGSQIYAVPIGQSGETIRGLRAFKVARDESFLIPQALAEAVLDPSMYVLPDPSGKKSKQNQSIQSFSTSTVDMTSRSFWKEFLLNRERLKAGDKTITSYEFNFEDSYIQKLGGERHVLWGMNLDKIYKSKNDPNKDKAIWLAENKNIPMDIAGGYYSLFDLEKASNIAIDEKIDLYYQLLLGCEAPCILGIDNAPTKANSAFTIIRVGTYEKKRRDPEKCKEFDYQLEDHKGCPYFDRNTGKCSLGDVCNVVFAYEENKMGLKDRVKLIYDLLRDYNIIRIYMDKRGGGWEVAEILRDAGMVQEITGEKLPPIYDPEDERNANLKGSPILTLLATDAPMNLQFNSYMKGQIAHLRLLFPRPVLVCSDNRLKYSYECLKTLLLQISRIKAVPSGSWFQFEIEGLDLEGRKRKLKKDLYSSLLYAMGGLWRLFEARDKEQEDLSVKELDQVKAVWINRKMEVPAVF